MSVQIPVTFDRASRRKDRSVAISFTTNTELTPQELMELDKLVLSEGWMLFAPNELQESDVPEMPAESKEGKPKIVRLRNVMYLLWLKTDQSEPFEPYWGRRFEQLMDQLKERL